MAHKVGRKAFGNRPDFLGISNKPKPAPFSDVTPPPTDSLAPFQPTDELGMPTPGIGGQPTSPYGGGMNFGGQPAQIQPAPVQQGMPCPDPSAHTQQQAPAQAPRPFPGVPGGFLGKALGGMARPSMMPMPRPRFFGGFRGLF